MKQRKITVIAALLLAMILTSSLAINATTTGKLTKPVDSFRVIDSTHVYFGSYPQREVVGEASQSGVYGNKYWGTTSTETNEQYIVDSNLYATLQGLAENKWDANGDATVEGAKYRRIKRNNATYYSSGSSYYYNWSNSTSYHYFKYEPIKWRVLKSTKDDAFLLCEMAIDNQKYNTSYTSITWEKSTVRSWLNGYGSSTNSYGTNYIGKGFYDTAFTQVEKGAIKTTCVVNENIIYETYGGNNTQDKVFLLSEDEVCGSNSTQYGFESSYSTLDLARQMKSSTYAKAMGVYSTTNASDDNWCGNCYWWLRSPGIGALLAARIRDSGNIDRDGNDVDCYGGVLPALYINLKTNNPMEASAIIPNARLTCDLGTDLMFYTGTAVEPDVEIEGLTKGEGYTASYANNVEVGTGKVIITGIGDWSGTLTKTFEIRKNIADKEFGLYSNKYTYSGSEKTPLVVAGGVTPDKDYTYEYSDNLNAGTGKVTITGKGDYVGTKVLEFPIEQKSISDMDVLLEKQSTLAPIIDGLEEGTDFDADCTEDTNNKTASVTITGKGNYKGTIEKVFDSIEAIEESRIKLESDTYVYSGKNITPKVTIDGLTENVDFKVSYDSNANVGTGNIQIKGTGSYYGNIKRTFTIKKYKHATEDQTTGKLTKQVSGFSLIDESHVYFGSYPQREVVGEASQSGVYGNSYWGTSETETNDQYIVDSSLYATLKGLSEDKWDANGDAIIEGTKYRRIRKSNATYGTAGSSTYYNWSDSSTYHYFKYEPIKWRLLKSTEDDAFLLCDMAIDNQRYNTIETSITWENSTVRSWLNGYGSSSNSYGTNYSGKGFYDTAFTETEKSAIKTTYVVNANNKHHGTNGGNNTQDKVFLLSEDEVYGSNATQYGFANSDTTYDTARQMKSSTYAKAIGACASTSSGYYGNCSWWLRSPSEETYRAADVYYDGYVYGNGKSACSDYGNGILPALHLHLKSNNPIEASEILPNIILTSDLMFYTGKAVEPDVEIEGLTEGEDYTVSYANNVDKGTATVKITAKEGSEWSGEITKTFEIVGTEVFELSQDTYTYDGTEKKPTVTIKRLDNEAVIASEIDYEVTYKNNINAGKAYAIVTLKGNYEGTLRKKFRIEPQDISDKDLTMSASLFACEVEESDRDEKEPVVSIEGLTKGQDYTVAYSNNKNPGTAKVVVTGIGNYKGCIEKTFRIGFVITDTIQLSQNSYTYDGTEKKPTVTVGSLVEGTDYTVEYSKNKNPGTATVMVTGIGIYIGSISKDFTITCEHTNASKTNAGDATCTADGNTAYWHCQDCNKYFADAECITEIEEDSWVISAKGHSWDTDYTVDKAATCTEKGYKSIHCLRCSETRDVTTINELGHRLVKYIAKPSTCLNKGNIECYYCEECNNYYSDGKCTHRIAKNSWIISAKGHSWDNGMITKQPTCTETGERTFRCTNDGCFATKTETISASGHSWNTDYTIDKTATCTSAGSKSIHCSNCSATEKETTISETGHKWDSGTVFKQPSCTVKGVKIYTCSNCKETKSEDIATLGHSWDNGTINKQPTCTETGVKTYKCTRSGCTETKTESIKATGHKHVHKTTPAGNLKNGEEYDECSVCGDKINSVIIPGYSTSYVKSFKVTNGAKSFTAKWKKQAKATQKKFGGYQIKYSVNADMSDAKTVNLAKSAASKTIKKLAKKKKYYVEIRSYVKKNGVIFYSKATKKTVVTK